MGFGVQTLNPKTLNRAVWVQASAVKTTGHPLDYNLDLGDEPCASEYSKLVGLGLRVSGSGFRVQGLGFRISGLGLAVSYRSSSDD